MSYSYLLLPIFPPIYNIAIFSLIHTFHNKPPQVYDIFHSRIEDGLGVDDPQVGITGRSQLQLGRSRKLGTSRELPRPFS